VRSEILGRPEKAATIGPLQCSTRLVRRRRGTLGSLRRRDRGQRAGRVAAHSLTLCLFCRRIETQCPILREGVAEDGRVTPSTPLPLGLAGLVIAKPASILFTGGQRNVSRQTGNSLPPLTQWRPVPMSARKRLSPSRSEPQPKKTAKSSKTIRANKRKAKLRAKHRRQRARATGSSRSGLARVCPDGNQAGRAPRWRLLGPR
jgi:hypothetical protein